MKYNRLTFETVSKQFSFLNYNNQRIYSEHVLLGYRFSFEIFLVSLNWKTERSSPHQNFQGMRFIDLPWKETRMRLYYAGKERSQRNRSNPVRLFSRPHASAVSKRKWNLIQLFPLEFRFKFSPFSVVIFIEDMKIIEAV